MTCKWHLWKLCTLLPPTSNLFLDVSIRLVITYYPPPPPPHLFWLTERTSMGVTCAAARSVQSCHVTSPVQWASSRTSWAVSFASAEVGHNYQSLSLCVCLFSSLVMLLKHMKYSCNYVLLKRRLVCKGGLPIRCIWWICMTWWECYSW